MTSRIIPLDMVGSTRFSRYSKISLESTYNFMITDNALTPFPGYKLVKLIKPGASQGRAEYRSPKFNHIIVVIDEDVYSVSNDYAVSKIGQLSTSTGAVFISENNANEICIVDGTNNIYVFNYSAESFQAYPQSFRMSYITFIDGYLVVPEDETHQYRLSNLNDGKTFPFDSQHVGELESSPDIVVATETLERQLFVFGENITEIWLDIPSNQTLFPFQRQNSISIEYGCISRTTISSGFGRIVWLGSNEKSGASILVSTGGKPEKISTDGIDFELDNLRSPEDSFGFLFEEGGHTFYLITFPSDNVSYAYDFNENKFFTVTDQNLNAHIARRLSFFNNTHLFITQNDGGLYELNSNYYTYKTTLDKDDDGYEVPRIRITSPKRAPGAKRYVCKNAGLTIEQGYSDIPLKVDLSLSKDGAKTFGNIWSKYLNQTGNRQNKMNFRQLGAANDLTLQFRFWGKDRFDVIDGYMEVSE